MRMGNITHLINKCRNDIERALIATLFLTGGRASEVLTLKAGQFINRKKHIVIQGMLVLKQRKEENKFRQVPILKNEPLTDTMLAWVKRVREIQPKVGHDHLFPYKYDWLYQRVTKIDKEWWPHRFRAERASQLAVEKEFGVIELMKWFGWAKEDMATHYAKMNVTDLVRKMSRGEM